jgi:hypothetical protein
MIEVTVTSVLQLPAGKMIFCKWPEGLASGEAEPRRDTRPLERRDPKGARDYRGEPRRESDRPGDRPALAPPVEAPRPPETAASVPPEAGAGVPSAAPPAPAPVAPGPAAPSPGTHVIAPIPNAPVSRGD